MTRQLITITPDGSLVGLDHKKKGLNLRQFGRAKTERATLIEWDEEGQLWEIYWAENKEGDEPAFLAGLFRQHGIDPRKMGGVVRDLLPDEEPLSERFDDSFVGFEQYEDAVTAEVAIIQARQLAGLSLT